MPRCRGVPQLASSSLAVPDAWSAGAHQPDRLLSYVQVRSVGASQSGAFWAALFLTGTGDGTTPSSALDSHGHSDGAQAASVSYPTRELDDLAHGATDQVMMAARRAPRGTVDERIASRKPVRELTNDNAAASGAHAPARAAPASDEVAHSHAISRAGWTARERRQGHPDRGKHDDVIMGNG